MSLPDLWFLLLQTMLCSRSIHCVTHIEADSLWLAMDHSKCHRPLCCSRWLRKRHKRSGTCVHCLQKKGVERKERAYSRTSLNDLVTPTLHLLLKAYHPLTDSIQISPFVSLSVDYGRLPSSWSVERATWTCAPKRYIRALSVQGCLQRFWGGLWWSSCLIGISIEL